MPTEELIPLNKYLVQALRFHFFILYRELYSYYRKADTDYFAGALRATLTELQRLEKLLTSPASQKFITVFDKKLLKFSGFGHRDQIKLFHLRTFFSHLIGTFCNQLSICEKMFFEDIALPTNQKNPNKKPLSKFWLVFQRIHYTSQYTVSTTLDNMMLDPELAKVLSKNFALALTNNQFYHLLDITRFEKRFDVIAEKLSEEQKKIYTTELKKLQLLDQEIDNRNSSSLPETMLNLFNSFDRFFRHAHLHFALYESSFRALHKAINTSSTISNENKKNITNYTALYRSIVTLSSILIESKASKEFFKINQTIENVLGQEVIALQKLNTSTTSQSQTQKIQNSLTEVELTKQKLFPIIKNINEGFYQLLIKLDMWSNDPEINTSIYPSKWDLIHKNILNIGITWSEYLDPIVPLLTHILMRNKAVEENRNNRTADTITKELLKKTKQPKLEFLEQKIYAPLSKNESGLPNKVAHQSILKLIKTTFKKPNTKGTTHKESIETILTSFAQSRYLFVELFKSDPALFAKSLPQLPHNLNVTLLKKSPLKSLGWNNDTALRLFKKLFRAQPNLFVTLPGSKLSEPLCHLLGINIDTVSPNTTLTLCPIRLIFDDQLPKAYHLINNEKEFSFEKPIPLKNFHAGIIFAIDQEKTNTSRTIFNETVPNKYPLEALIYQKPEKLTPLINEQIKEKEIQNTLSKQLKSLSQKELQSITERSIETLKFSLLVPAYLQLLQEPGDIFPQLLTFNTLFTQASEQCKKQETISTQVAEFSKFYNQEVYKDTTIHPHDFIDYLDTLNKGSLLLRNYCGNLKKLDTELFTSVSTPSCCKLNDTEGKTVNGSDIFTNLFLEFNKYPYLFDTQQITMGSQSILSKHFKTPCPPPFVFLEERFIVRFLEIQQHLKKTGILTAYSASNPDGSIHTLVSLKELQAHLNATIFTNNQITALFNLHNSQKSSINTIPYDVVTHSTRYFTHFKALFASLLQQDLNNDTKPKIAHALRFLSIRDLLVLKNRKHAPLIKKLFSEAYFLYGNYADTHLYIVAKQKAKKNDFLSPLVHLYQKRQTTSNSAWNKKICIQQPETISSHTIFELVSDGTKAIIKK